MRRHAWLLLSLWVVLAAACSSGSNGTETLDASNDQVAGDDVDVQADVCVPQCEGMECGPDGCGGFCGECYSGFYCDKGTCRGEAEGCSILCEGIGCGEMNDTESGLTCDCGDCEGPLECIDNQCQSPVDPCDAACAGLNCGEALDVDGNVCACGTCEAGSSCVNGHCEEDVCVPDCEGKECGDNGCDGSCGECEAGWECVDFHCVDLCAGACDGKECGQVEINGATCDCGTCEGDLLCNPLTYACVSCLPVCEDPVTWLAYECGDDSCGGSCGECETGDCIDHACVCTPDCAGKQCGDDGCGGSCGECEFGECVDQVCVCEPECNGKNCGDDGCGSTCGTCDDGQACFSGVCTVFEAPVTCEGIFECLGTCPEEEAACEELCLGSAPEDVTVAFNEFVICITDAGYWDCADGDDACYSAALDQCVGQYAACYMTGEGTCKDLYVCLVTCETDAACQACYEPVSASGYVMWNEVVSCLDANGYFDCDQGDSACYENAWSACDGPMDLCVAGNLDCVGILECLMACPDSDSACSVGCQVSGNDQGSASFDALLDCLFSNCGDQPTTECQNQVLGVGGVCSDEYDACVGACVPDCNGKECGSNGCGGLCGQCAQGYECNDVGICELGDCTPDCTGKECGSDGCAGSCGTCGTGLFCDAQGLCQAGTGPQTCEEIDTCIGNCSGDQVCAQACFDAAIPEAQEVYIAIADCLLGECPDWDNACLTQAIAGVCQDPYNACFGGEVVVCSGWTCDPRYYDAADGCDCNCGCWDPDCDLPDQQLYNCNDGETCEQPGVCVGSCVPACDGKACGDDGCGGTCGECDDGFGCGTDFNCHPTTCEGSCGDQSLGGCWCDEECATYGDCCTDVCTFCGDLSHCGTCVPDCGGKECGDDGCGGSCGTCAVGAWCDNNGLCQTQGGPQTCEEIDSCIGTCGDDQTCAQACYDTADPSAQALYEDIVDCILAECPDWDSACINTAIAGACLTPYEACFGAPLEACDGWTCNLNYYNASDGCDCDCGCWDPDCDLSGQALYGCGDGQTCEQPGICAGECIPNCDGKECGDDGCGGTCGDCAQGSTCLSDFVCHLNPCSGWTCDPRYYAAQDGCDCDCGCWDPDCDLPDQLLYNCADGEWCEQPGICVGNCVPNCDGKECGDDGCGGTCGGCADAAVCGTDFVCHAASCEGSCGGQSLGLCWCDEECVSWGDCCADVCTFCGELSHCGTCVPDCSGKECGDDGCGGSCGICDTGLWCDATGLCQTQAGPQTCEQIDTCMGNCNSDQACAQACYDSADPAAQVLYADIVDCLLAECPDWDSTCINTAVAGVCQVQYEACFGAPVQVCDGWTCSAAYYSAEDGCDCDCGCWDPDCDLPDQNLYNCGDGQWCEQPGICVGDCTPDCSGKECGDDGCGGSCGDCGTDAYCDALGLCQEQTAPQSCEEIDLCVGNCNQDPTCAQACYDNADAASQELYAAIVDCLLGECPDWDNACISTAIAGVCQAPYDACFSPTTACSGWTCNPSYYAAGDGCDCGCGCWDPDCDDPAQQTYGCAGGELCVAPGVCEASAPCFGWTCNADYYNAGDGCDCDCGCWDPDCTDPEQSVWGCDPGQICVLPGVCQG